MSERIGFIGVGSQGAPMAHRIADAGMDLTVWARRPEVLAPYAAKGCTTAHSVAELGSSCDHIGICVVNDQDVDEICAQLLPAMRSGSRIALHSTILPETCVRLEAQFAERGIGLIDAPVSGGSPVAERGELTVMCGADKAVFEAARPVFETFGRLIVLLGPAGSGQRAKIVNNAMLSANMGIAMAALSAVQELGLDRAAFAEVINASSGRSFGFEVFARLPDLQAFAHGARMNMKDIRLLQSILPGHPGAEALWDTAEPFLTAATGG